MPNKPKNIEFLDIVDANNNIIGKASRQEIHEKSLMHRASHILISHNNHVFLQFRAKTKKDFPNLWDASAAGHVSSGESYLHTAIRELEEELGLKAKTDSLIELGDIPASINTGHEFIKVYYIDYPVIPKIKLEYNEITTGGWFSIEHISSWIKSEPQSFAGCFYIIWRKYLEHLNTI